MQYCPTSDSESIPFELSLIDECYISHLKSSDEVSLSALLSNFS